MPPKALHKKEKLFAIFNDTIEEPEFKKKILIFGLYFSFSRTWSKGLYMAKNEENYLENQLQMCHSPIPPF